MIEWNQSVRWENVDYLLMVEWREDQSAASETSMTSCVGQWWDDTLTVLLVVLWFVWLFCDQGLWLSRRGRMSLTRPSKAMQRPLGVTQCSLSVPCVFLSSSLAPNSELILFARAVQTQGFLVLAKKKRHLLMCTAGGDPSTRMACCPFQTESKDLMICSLLILRTRI